MTGRLNLFGRAQQGSHYPSSPERTLEIEVPRELREARSTGVETGRAILADLPLLSLRFHPLTSEAAVSAFVTGLLAAARERGGGEEAVRDGAQTLRDRLEAAQDSGYAGKGLSERSWKSQVMAPLNRAASPRRPSAMERQNAHRAPPAPSPKQVARPSAHAETEVE